MAKLEGIIYKAFENFIVFRGYAPIGTLAEVSKRPEAYQRTADDEHKRDLIRFLKKKEYSYFPELVLAYRGANLVELIKELHGNDDIDFDAEKYVKGLKVLKERVPATGYRARHAQLTVDSSELLRVDGNHRLEPFNDDDEWWRGFIDEKEPDEYNEEQKKAWLTKQIEDYKSDVKNIIVPFSIVISNIDIADRFEASIFNNINFKQLPLKQEKNIQNIYKFLKDSDELGKAHELTIKLIELTENGHFIGLPLFERGENEIYRTVCLKTVELLLSQQEELSTKKNEIEAWVNQKRLELEELGEQKDNQTSENESVTEKNIKELERIIDNYENQIKSINNYCCSISPDAIEIAIQSLRPVYNAFGERYGNISVFVALVYFKLLNEHKFTTFVDWIVKNGINRIPVEDYMPTHSAKSLISLFERVYEAKGREIFISMRFGDPQSEMIYEKIVQTIEKFNQEKGLDIIIRTIRIDQKITSELFDIPKEITCAIENSGLIIADLSSQNINVYHEVGMAMGLAKAKGVPASIILLYKTDTSFRDDKKFDVDHFIGFNIRAESQLRFQTYKQLVDGLKERLEKHFEV
ncbi:MAG: hypothetical protein IJG41_06520 [Bacteroidales bacterium]|nr:hypothetical protein [Bacteroidales bacterium]